MATRAGLALAVILLLSMPVRAGEAPPAKATGETAPIGEESKDMLEELKNYRHKIVIETNREGNWELYLMNADGSNPVNLTKTPDVDELYPKASPEGSKICFCADEMVKGAKSRNLYLMNLDGTGRTKICGNAREPCWNADGSAIAFLKGEFDRYDAMDYVTKGIFMYDVKSGAVREHPNKKILHLYCLNWTPDGAWFVATVHGGMGFKHSILALGANDDKVFDLQLGGCRPDVSPDGKIVVWAHGDLALGMADLIFSADSAQARFTANVVQSMEPIETNHADWSPDGKYIAFTRGPKPKGKRLGLAPGIPGSVAPGWNTCVADASAKNRWVAITTDGKSNKEPDWVFVKDKDGK